MISGSKNNKELIFVYILGLIIFFWTLTVVLGKMDEAVINEQNILTLSGIFNNSEILIIIFLSLLFLFFLIFNKEIDKELWPEED